MTEHEIATLVQSTKWCGHLAVKVKELSIYQVCLNAFPAEIKVLFCQHIYLLGLHTMADTFHVFSVFWPQTPAFPTEADYTRGGPSQ